MLIEKLCAMGRGFKEGSLVRKAPFGLNERARHASGGALSIAVLAFMALALTPCLSAYAEQGSTSEQLQPGTYWYNGDVDFATIDSSNGFSSRAWDDYRDTGLDGTGNALGIAGSFHLVAFDSLSASEAVYGNVLAKKVTSNSDFGTDSRFDDLYGHSTLSYIQDYQGRHSRFGASSFAKQAVVFGNNSAAFGLFAKESSGHQIINYKNSSTSGTVVEFPATIGQDLDSSSDPFINLDTIKQEMKSLSAGLATRSSGGGATYDFSKADSKQIKYNARFGCAYLSLPASELAKSGSALDIVGLPADGSGTLVINVDCEGSSVTLPEQINLYLGGKAASFDEIDSDTGFVLWNFYNCADTSITATSLVGSILAPGASLTLNGNACGTFIADTISVKGNTRARPFHGSFDPVEATTSVVVKKAWLDSEGQPELGVSHDVVTAQLWYADENGTATEPVLDSQGKKVTAQLSEASGWKATFDGLPSQQDGTALRYTVAEVDVPEGYELSGVSCEQKDDSYVFTITNSAKSVAPSPSEDDAEDPSEDDAEDSSEDGAQDMGDGSSEADAQNKVKKAASSAEQRELAKTGDSARVKVALVFAAGLLCVIGAARRIRRSEIG